MTTTGERTDGAGLEVETDDAAQRHHRHQGLVGGAR